MRTSRRLSGSTSEGSSALHSDLFLLAKPDRTLVCQDRARRHCARRVHVGARLAQKAHEVHPALQQRAKDSKVALLRSYASHYSQFSRYSPLVEQFECDILREFGNAGVESSRFFPGVPWNRIGAAVPGIRSLDPLKCAKARPKTRGRRASRNSA